MTENEARNQYKKDKNLYGANLSKANLYGANLSWANLYGANLSLADMSEANLYGANLYGAKLYGTIGLSGRSIVPEVGSFHGFKRLRMGVICELLIPELRSRPTD